MSKFLLDSVSQASRDLAKVMPPALQKLVMENCPDREGVLIECLRQTDQLRTALSDLRVHEHNLVDDLHDLTRAIDTAVHPERDDYSVDVCRKALINRLNRVLYWVEKGAWIKCES